MSGYIGINLRDILNDDSLGESVARNVLSSFSCPLNPDVEYFLRHTAKGGITNHTRSADITHLSTSEIVSFSR